MHQQYEYRCHRNNISSSNSIGVRSSNNTVTAVTSAAVTVSVSEAAITL
jgi:hypothetical protein